VAPVGVIEAPRVQLKNGLCRTKKGSTSLPMTRAVYISRRTPNVSSNGGSAEGRCETKKKLACMSLIPHSPVLGILGGFRRRLEGDVIAELGDLSDEALDLRLRRSAVEVGDAQILVEGSVLEHVIDGGQDRSGHGADGFLRAAPRLQAEELGPVIAGFCSLGRPSAL